MENNENLNNQVNEKNNQVTENRDTNQSNKGNNKVLVIIMGLIIVILVGYIVYAKFIQKGDESKGTNPTPTPAVTPTIEVTPEPTNEPSSTSTPSSTPVSADKNVYKTADGKHSLNVKEFKNKSNPKLVYDGKTINVAKDDGGPYGLYEKVGKYAVYGDGNGQCSEYFFVVNTEDNTLLNLDNHMYNRVEQIGDSYYFIQKKFCGSDGFDLHKGVYTESLKKIGTAYFGKDGNSNFYVLDNGVVVKYNKNGKELFRSSKKYNQERIIEWYTSNSCEPTITNDNLYFAYNNENGSEYLIDVVGGNEIQINKKSDSEYKMSFFGCNYDSGPSDFVFTYELESCGKGCWSDRLIYTYNIKTNSLTSKVEKDEESVSYTE